MTDQWAQVLGYRAEELPPHGQFIGWLSEQTHPEDRETLDRAYADLEDGRSERYSIQIRLRHRGGHWIWVQKMARETRSSSTRRSATSTESPSAKPGTAAGRPARRSHHAARLNLRSAGTCDLVQPALVRVHGKHVGGHAGRGVGPGSSGGARCRGTVGGHLPTARGGRRVPLVPVPGDSIYDDAGEVIRWFGTNTDVTELREVEQKLLQADRQKDQCLAMLGHELRNPLAAIHRASELLKTVTGGDETLLATQEIIGRQTSHMAKLLDGLLDVSRMIRGKIQLERETLDLVEVCRPATSDVVAGLGDRQLDVVRAFPDDPIWVEGDRVRLAQIVSNLLADAVKFTPDDGTVRIALRREERRKSQVVVLEVRDTGVGIAPDLLPHVFEIFRQSNQGIDRSEGGIGLGLALVKTLAELHGGSAEAHSEGEGRGAVLAVTLPTSRCPSGRSADPLEVDTLRKILVIEDNEDAAEMLKRVLERLGHEVAVATRGADGLAVAREQRPDAVVCDLGLPGGLNGFEVAGQLRADERTCAIILVALSGYARPEDRQQSLEAGFDAHLAKPVDVGELQRVLGEVSQRRSLSPGEAARD